LKNLSPRSARERIGRFSALTIFHSISDGTSTPYPWRGREDRTPHSANRASVPLRRPTVVTISGHRSLEAPLPILFHWCHSIYLVVRMFGVGARRSCDRLCHPGTAWLAPDQPPPHKASQVLALSGFMPLVSPGTQGRIPQIVHEPGKTGHTGGPPRQIRGPAPSGGSVLRRNSPFAPPWVHMRPSWTKRRSCCHW
jgi:hypothetical protein